ncbi:hypothetical protein AK830_g4607 [Neonectria ditissima]|uniref:BTB domain-containing protein n=1 Tax=Neonectria ditissima TaxID=78410 RepID=A0A0P7BMJ7_9HYPO|nr:hypothetical protein AK830_g4607 [Neonectria ditissima]
MSSAGPLPVLKGLLTSGDYSDLLLKVGDEEFHLHKAVVCPQSPVIAAAFRGNYKEANTDTFKVEGFDADTVRCMIDFMYTGRYDVESTLGSVSPDVQREHSPLAFPGLSPEHYERLSTTASEPQSSAAQSANQATLRLLRHVGMNAIADFYDIEQLRELANSRIEAIFQETAQADGFSIVAETVWSSTSDKKLYNLLTTVAAEHIDQLVKSKSFLNLEEVSDFSSGVFRACAARIAELEKQLHCNSIPLDHNLIVAGIYEEEVEKPRPLLG